MHSLQDRTRLTPLSEWTGDPQDYTPGEMPVNPAVDTRTPPVDQVAAMDGEAFFTRLDALLDDNPPRPEDTEMMKQLSDIGIGLLLALEVASAGRYVMPSIELREPVWTC